MLRAVPKWQIVLASTLVPAILFLSFPRAIITANAHEITFTRGTLYLCWVLFAATSAVLAGLAVVMKDKGRRLLLALSACCAVNILSWNAAFAHVWLNTPAKLTFWAIAELAFFGLCLWVALRIPSVFLLRLTSIFATLLIGVSAFQQVPLWNRLPKSVPSPHKAESLPNPDQQDDRFAGNVYHIVLDAFSPEYLTYRLNRGDAPVLNGYTFYPRAISNYGRTNLSMRSVFTGSFHPEDLTAWENAFSEGFSADLRRSQIGLYYFPYYSTYCDPEAIVCRATNQLYRYYRKHLGYTFLIDIIFQSSLPVSVRDYILGSIGTETRETDTWDYGFSLTTWVRSFIEGGAEFPKWRQPVQSLTMDTLADFLATEAKLPASGRYTYLHMMVPHGPYNFDPDCGFVPPERQSTKTEMRAYEDQYACALTVVEKITSRLRELNRFDNSLVIFHGDHGFYRPAVLSQWDPAFEFDPSIEFVNRQIDENVRAMPSQQIAANSGVLLLVHKPNQTNFDKSAIQPQLIDIAPTILDFFDIDRINYPGVSLLSSNPPAHRPTVYYESSTNILKDLHRFGKYLQQGDGWVFDAWSTVTYGGRISAAD